MTEFARASRWATLLAPPVNFVSQASRVMNSNPGEGAQGRQNFRLSVLRLTEGHGVLDGPLEPAQLEGRSLDGLSSYLWMTKLTLGAVAKQLTRKQSDIRLISMATRGTSLRMNLQRSREKGGKIK